MPNVSKSTIHFPSWPNKKVCKAVVNILGMTTGSYPFKYLGCLIGPKHLAKNYFQPLVNRA